LEPLPSMQQIDQTLLWMQSSKVEQHLLVFRQSAVPGRSWLRRVNAIGNNADWIAQTEAAESAGLRFAQPVEARGAAQMVRLVGPQRCAFSPAVVLDRPAIEHTVRRNHVGSGGGARPTQACHRRVHP